MNLCYDCRARAGLKLTKIWDAGVQMYVEHYVCTNCIVRRHDDALRRIRDLRTKRSHKRRPA